MQHATKMFFTFAIAMNISAMASENVTIRPAEMRDLEAINNLCSFSHHNDGFKKGLDQALNEWMMWGTVTDDWVEKETDRFVKIETSNNQKCIMQQQQAKSSNERLLVAYVKEESDNSEKLAGYCRFNKDNAKQILMSCFVVNPELRNKGIGKLLAREAFKTFNGITACKFRWLAKDTTMNDLFVKHCTEVNNVHMDYCSGHIIEDLSEKELEDKIVLPIMFREFVFDLKRIQFEGLSSDLKLLP